jgi:energy-coupling factor transporter ATP-binding protein EcfA2
MGKIDSITYNELLRECNISDPNDLQRILRTRKGFPQVSHRKLVPKKDAEYIVKNLTGHQINWLKYITVIKDSKDEGPLKWNSNSAVLKTIDGWYKNIENKLFYKGSEFRLLALACVGGFLSGHEESEFILGFDKGVNVIIGDRGSGKSTVLNLLGAISDSVGEETQTLVRRMLSILNPGKAMGENETAKLNRRLLKTLKDYSINLYAIYFQDRNAIYCYYINRKKNEYSFLKFTDSTWEFEKSEQKYLNVPLLFLSQGEIIRIAEDREQKYYLNNILDAIYPDLFDIRTNMIETIHNILLRHDNYKRSNINYETKHVKKFIYERRGELLEIKSGIQNGEFSSKSEILISDFIKHYQNYRQKQEDNFWEKKTIIEYFQEEDIDGLYYLYINKIKNFLYKKLSLVEDLRNHKEILSETHPDLFKNHLSQNMEFGIDPDKLDLAADRSEELEFEDESEILPTLDDDLEDIDVKDEEDIIGMSEEEREFELFSKSIETSKRTRVNRELLVVATELVDFLEKRLRVMENWVRIYSHRREVYSTKLVSLIKDYNQVLAQRILLIQHQADRCSLITEILNKENLNINIATPLKEQVISEISTQIQKSQDLDYCYKQIFQATANFNLHDLRNVQYEYDHTIKLFHEELKFIGQQLQDENLDFFTFPIKIELLQGNSFRDFQQLSFGQKSGIILKMVLATTNKSVILIDQPEDNLDTYSIINIIAPVLKNLETLYDRQIIIVTHNSSLVMESAPTRLIVLESRGDNGIIKFQGMPVTQQAISEIFEILEGGISTFSQKIKTYENFFDMARKNQDWNIHLIESSFRRRTIDGLRNYLQPIVSDSAILSFLRHQLKQWDPKVFRQQIREFINNLERMEQNPKEGHDELLTMLTELADGLDDHIERFMSEIDKLRLMDTQPKFQVVDLYSLFRGLCEDPYINRLEKSRKIKIEVGADIQGVNIFADPNHLKLVFNNLIENSLRATEKVAMRRRNIADEYIETVTFAFDGNDQNLIKIKYSDNGCGIPSEILDKLYIEPCSTKPGKEHGLGGVIIFKLLEINNGSIAIVESRTAEANSGSIQKIILSRAPVLELQNEKNTSSG